MDEECSCHGRLRYTFIVSISPHHFGKVLPTTYSTRSWGNRKRPVARTNDEHENTRRPSSLPRTNISERLQFAYGYMQANIPDIRL